MKTKFVESPKVTAQSTKAGDVFFWREVAYMRTNETDVDEYAKTFLAVTLDGGVLQRIPLLEVVEMIDGCFVELGA